MLHSRYFILLLTLPIIALACGVLAVAPVGPTMPYEHFLIGVVLGTLYGQTTVAAAWTAFGPGPLILRLPMSILWVALILVVFSVSSAIRKEPGELGSIMTYSQCAQWIVSQIPYWTIALIFRLRLRHRSEQGGDYPRGQFGIAQLMIITAIIGVVLGIARLLIVSNYFKWDVDPDMPIFFFLVGTAIVMTLPLVLAAFLGHYAAIAMCGALAFVFVVTVAEMPLLMATVGTRGGPDVMHLIWINVFTTVWVLSMVMATRFAGYRFSFAEKLVRKPAE